MKVGRVCVDGRGDVPRRGDLVRTLGDAGGRYVGTSPNDIDWIAYLPGDFARLCAAFDAEWKSLAEDSAPC